MSSVYGLQVETDDRSGLLVSADAKCLHFLGVATFESVPSSTTARYTITSASRPLVFARLDLNEQACVYSVSNSGDTWFISVCGPSRASVELLCYAPLTTEGPTSAYGIRMFMSNGEVAFDTTRQPLWLSELFTQYGDSLTPSSMVANYARTYTRPALTIYAVAQSTPGPGGGIYYLGIKKTSTGHVYAWCTFSSGTGTPTTASKVNSTVFVIESAGLT